MEDEILITYKANSMQSFSRPLIVTVHERI